MPIFMDRHDIPGVTAEDVAEAHQKDLKIQEEYSCRALTYWYDREKEMAFCLIEAPDKESVQKLHNYAHGLIPNQIIEVERNTVESFLGRIKDPDDQESHGSVINDPAFRSIMVAYPNEVAQLHSKLHSEKSAGVLENFRNRIKKEIKHHHGREVEHTDTGFIASFPSVTKSVLCALKIQNYFALKGSVSHGKNHYRIGISAGVPVSGDDTFFGKTLQLAKQLAVIADPGNIMLSSLVGKLYLNTCPSSQDRENSLSILSSQEEDFLSEVMKLVRGKACDGTFDVGAFERQMGMSKSRLYRKLTSVTGYSPNEFIKEYRLRTALRLIALQQGNISEIAYSAGFSSLSYFSKCFHQRFHILPSDYSSSLAH